MSTLDLFQVAFRHWWVGADGMLMSTSLRGVTRCGVGLCALRAARGGNTEASGGRRWRWCRLVASSSPSSPSSSSSSPLSRQSTTPSATPSATLQVISSSKHATDVLAAYFASSTGLAPGDCYLLFGPVGAGKSHFSRTFIRYAMDDDDLEVPSPTFLLHNSYQGSGGVVHHYDLYRLTDAREGEYERLDLGGSFASGVSLIEWPERLVEMDRVPAERVELRISLVGGGGWRGGGQEQREERELQVDDERGTDDEEDGDGDEDGDDEEEVGSARCVEIRVFGERFGDVVRTLGSHVATNGAKLGLTSVSE